MTKPSQYTCNEYRQEMMLLGLKRRLHSDALSKEEEKTILKQIKNLEKQMGL